MSARRPLLTAAAAGSVLLALWFVPSANAIVGDDGATNSGLRTASAPVESGLADRAHSGAQDTDTRSTTTTSRGSGPDTGAAATPRHFLADTGSPDTTPYVVGGAACLALGAGLVGYSVRRTRDETA